MVFSKTEFVLAICRKACDNANAVKFSGRHSTPLHFAAGYNRVSWPLSILSYQRHGTSWPANWQMSLWRFHPLLRFLFKVGVVEFLLNNGADVHAKDKVGLDFFFPMWMRQTSFNLFPVGKVVGWSSYIFFFEAPDASRYITLHKANKSFKSCPSLSLVQLPKNLYPGWRSMLMLESVRENETHVVFSRVWLLHIPQGQELTKQLYWGQGNLIILDTQSIQTRL